MPSEAAGLDGSAAPRVRGRLGRRDGPPRPHGIAGAGNLRLWRDDSAAYAEAGYVVGVLFGYLTFASGSINCRDPLPNVKKP